MSGVAVLYGFLLVSGMGSETEREAGDDPVAPGFGEVVGGMYILGGVVVGLSTTLSAARGFKIARECRAEQKRCQRLRATISAIEDPVIRKTRLREFAIVCRHFP